MQRWRTFKFFVFIVACIVGTTCGLVFVLRIYSVASFDEERKLVMMNPVSFDMVLFSGP